MLDHRWRRMGVALMAALFICAITACVMAGIALPKRGVAVFTVDQQFGSTRVVGYATWNAYCPPFTGCEPTTKQSYVVWMIEEQGDAAGVVRNSQRMLAVPLELWR